MVPATNLLAFALAALLLIAVPGPSVLFVIGRTLALGRRGGLLSVLGNANPKSIIFFVAVLPQFVDYSSGAIPLQLATLGALFLAIALASDSGWALVAGTARRWFASSTRRIAALGTTGGAMMIGLGGTLALAGNGADPLPGK